MIDIRTIIDKLQLALDTQDSLAVSILITRLENLGFKSEIKDKTVTVTKVQ